MKLQCQRLRKPQESTTENRVRKMQACTAFNRFI